MLKVSIAVLVACLVAILIWPKSILSELPPSEFRLKALLYFQKEGYEELLKEASKTPYMEIAWSAESDFFTTAKLEKGGERIKKPEIPSVIGVAKDQNITGFSIVKDDYGWILMHMYEVQINGVKVDLMLQHGESPNIEDCKNLEILKSNNGFCFERIFNKWYMTKFWNADGNYGT